MAATTLRFGQVEAVLADLNEIPSTDRTGFQAKLKDLQRFGLLRMGEQVRGKAAAYSLRELALFAVAVDLCQLGLSAKRAVQVVKEGEYPLWMGLLKAAQKLNTSSADSPAWFFFFDPSVLTPKVGEGADQASNTFFYCGLGQLAEMLGQRGEGRRLALIDVATLLTGLARHPVLAGRGDILKEFEAVANHGVHHADFDLDEWVEVKAPAWLRAKTKAGDEDLRPDLEAWAADLEWPLFDFTTDRTKLLVKLPAQREFTVDISRAFGSKPAVGLREYITELASRSRGSFEDNTKYSALLLSDPDDIAEADTLAEQALSSGVVLLSPAAALQLYRDVFQAWDARGAEGSAPYELQLLRDYRESNCGNR